MFRRTTGDVGVGARRIRLEPVRWPGDWAFRWVHILGTRRTACGVTGARLINHRCGPASFDREAALTGRAAGPVLSVDALKPGTRRGRGRWLGGLFHGITGSNHSVSDLDWAGGLADDVKRGRDGKRPAGMGSVGGKQTGVNCWAGGELRQRNRFGQMIPSDGIEERAARWTRNRRRTHAAQSGCRTLNINRR